MIADKLVELKVIDYFKKANLSLGLSNNSCIPKPGAEFAAAMKDRLDVYRRPFNPLFKVM